MNTSARSGMPPVVSREVWRVARKALLAREKEFTRLRDAVNAARRRLPMVKIEKPYTFVGPEGTLDLPTLFAGRRQLLVHHFMWFEERQAFCKGCTGAAHHTFNNPRLREVLAGRDVTFVAISRAPFAQIATYKAEHGWTFPWYSSQGSDFNYDFHTTLGEAKTPIEYNYRNKAELLAAGFAADSLKEDWPANSVFLRDGNDVYHTYSAYARGLDSLHAPDAYLDLTPYGRQEEWEDSPAGWPKQPTYA
ncbi:MAG: DUF899 domain-containing protein [Opitutaceae bacterium]